MDFFSKYRPSIIALCEKHKVKRLFAFSVLTSRFTEKSDIDLVVDFDKEVEQVDYVNNFFDLRDALSAIFHREIDVLEDKAIRNPVLRRNIDRTKSLIYG